MKKEFRFIHAALAISVLLIISISIFGCKKNEEQPGVTGSPGADEVWMQNTAFNPATITVAVNTTITWTNKDVMNHTVNSDTGSVLNSNGNINGGGTFSHKFTAAGTFPYHCNIHTGMKGTVIVN